MVLFPKKTKFKKFFKFKNLFSKIENRYLVPKVGVTALKLVSGGRVSMSQLEAARKVCKRKLRLKFKREIPKFSVFTDIGISKKSSGVRMGKGKGAVEFWATFAHTGRVILELSDTVNNLAAAKALTASSFKLPHKTKLVFSVN